MDASALISATGAWQGAFPGAVAGALVMLGVANPEHSDALEEAKWQLEDELRAGTADGRVLRA